MREYCIFIIRNMMLKKIGFIVFDIKGTTGFI